MRRIVLVTARPAFAAELASALGDLPDSAVETRAPEACADDAALAALWILDLAEGSAVPPLRGPIVAIAPRAELGAWLDLLAASDAVVGVIAAEAALAAELRALAERLLDASPAGFEALLAADAEVHERTIGEYFEKQRCMAEVVAAAERLQLPRRTQRAIEQCVDELAMNALFDAPVDETGRPVFAGVPSGTRVRLRTDASAVVRFGWDARRFVVGVRDEFGTLSRATVLAHLAKGLRASEPVDRRAGGAGLGLYLTVSSASAVWFEVTPGRCTDVVCAFDRAATGDALARLGFRLRGDTAGASPPRAARSRPAMPLRARIARRIAAHPRIALAVAAVILVAAIAPRILGRSAAPRAVQVDLSRVARVELASTPEGAAVQIDGRRVGWTPVELDDLPPSSTVAATLALDGYRPATAQLHVPAAGQHTRVVQPLALADGKALVHFESDPPGAAIVRTGERPSSDRTYTPADVLVDTGVAQRFSLEMPGHATVDLPPFTVARGASALTEHATLPATRE